MYVNKLYPTLISQTLFKSLLISWVRWKGFAEPVAGFYSISN